MSSAFTVFMKENYSAVPPVTAYNWRYREEENTVKNMMRS